MTSPLTHALPRPLTYPLTAPLGSVMGQGGGGGVPVVPLRFAAAETDTPNETVGLTGALLRYRSQVHPLVDCSEFWYALPGIWLDSVGNVRTITNAAGLSVQTSLSNGTIVKQCNGKDLPGDDAGAATFALNLSGHSWCHAKASDFSLATFQQQAWFVKHEYTGSSGDEVPDMDNITVGTGEACFRNGVSQLLTAGGYTAGGGSSVAARGIVAAAVARHSGKALLGIGDSIMFCQGQTGGSGFDTGTGHWGFFSRAAKAAGIPFGKWAIAGIQTSQLTAQIAAAALLFPPFVTYATDVWDESGINDIRSGGVSFATMKARKKALWDLLLSQNPAVKIHATTIGLSTTSAGGNWIDAADQTVSPASFVYSAGNTVYDFNQWLLAGGDGYLTSCVDLRPAIEDPSNPGKFITDGVTPKLMTGDGIHPTGTAGHPAMAALLQPHL